MSFMNVVPELNFNSCCSCCHTRHVRPKVSCLSVGWEFNEAIICMNGLWEIPWGYRWQPWTLRRKKMMKKQNKHKRKKHQNKNPHVVGIDIILGKMYKPWFWISLNSFSKLCYDELKDRQSCPKEIFPKKLSRNKNGTIMSK